MAKKPINIFGKKGGFPASPLPGQQPAQINIGPNDITFKPCEKCGHEFFDTVLRPGLVSSLNPKNPTGKDMPVNVPVLLCRACGWEFGVKVTVPDDSA